MKAKHFTCLLLLITFIQSLFGQVRLQTGAAEVSIPLYNYSDPNNRIGISAALIYTAGGGLKVNDIASSVGTGWLLDCGGVITRVQNGEPDDQKQNTTYPYPTVTDIYKPSTDWNNLMNYANNYYPNGYMYSEYDFSQTIDNGGAYIPMFNAPYKYKPHSKYLTDREQDYFEFTFNGHAGQFIIPKEIPGSPISIKTTGDSRLKIEKVTTDMTSSGIRTTISEFQITDEFGIKYIFKELELAEVINYDTILTYYNNNNVPYYNYPNGDIVASAYNRWSSPLNDCRNIYKGKAIGQFIVTKWYLSEIINPITNIKIILNYEAYNVDITGSKIATLTKSNTIENLIINHERKKGVAKRLKSINCSSNEKVEFNYANNNRFDLPYDKQLDEVVVKYGNITRYKWVFSFGYFVKNEIKSSNSNFTQNDRDWSRLCLKSIQKIGAISMSEPPYVFSYNLGSSITSGNFDAVPPMFSYYYDHWGYYNANATIWNNGTLNEPLNDNAAIAWFNYDNPLNNPMQCRQPQSGFAKNGILNSIQYPAGGVLTFEYEQNTATYGQQQVLMGGVRVKRTWLYNGEDHLKDIVKEYKYVNESGTSSGWGYETGSYSKATSTRIWKCAGGVKYPGMIAKSFASGVTQNIGLNLLSGNKITFSGSLSAGVQSAIITIGAIIIVNILTDLFSSDFSDFTVSEYNSFSNIYSNLLPFQYSRVEVIDQISADIGKTVFEFTSDQDYPFEVPVLTFPYSNRQRFTYWAYGLPKIVSVLKNGNPIKKTENYYQVFKNAFSSQGFGSQKWSPNKRLFACDFQLVPGQPSNDISSEIYYPICGRTDLIQTKEYIYNDASDFTVNTTDYLYFSSNYLPGRIKTTNSKGEEIEILNMYSVDYGIPGVIQSMKDRNMVNVPISSFTFIKKPWGNTYMTGGAVSEFDFIPNGDINITKTHRFRSPAPALDFLVPVSAAQLIPSTSFFKETGSIVYNNLGQSIQVNSDVGKASTIYDYNNQLSVASVANAAIGDIAYSSFEADGFGGWTMVPGSTIVNQGGITGSRSFSGTLTKNLTQGNYVITAWAKDNSDIAINGNSGTLLRTIGVWKLYTWNLNSISSVTVVAANLDELRLYPRGAQMTTNTYEPLIGKTSDCDENNRLTYYEYDDLGRLRFVRDENRNIVKMYEYNYKF